MKIFYLFAGIDPQLIASCPLHERIRNIAIGFLVFLVSLISLISIAYACLNFLEVKAAHSFTADALAYSLSVFIGLIWFMVVSNIYRSCLTISGIGDGTSKITKDEFINAIPQFILVVFLGYCLSAPLTVLLLNKQTVQGIVASDVDRISLNEAYVSKRNLNGYTVGIANINVIQFDKDYQDLKAEQGAHQKKYTHSFISILLRCYDQHSFLSFIILITSLFLYLIPLILRLIWVKGIYEYKVDIQNRIVLEKYGIYPDYYSVKYKGNEYLYDRYISSEKWNL
jgi:hypothetical protein